uniref:Uncharacterized protein n=1 Tax=Dulem virus 180 TaxID=3145657 RepID=A0AAU8B8A0_9VIRU
MGPFSYNTNIKSQVRPASEGAPLTGVAGNRLRAKRAKSSVSHLIPLVYKVRTDTNCVSMSSTKCDITRATPNMYTYVRARVSCARVCVCMTYLRVKALPYSPTPIGKTYRYFFFINNIDIMLNSGNILYVCSTPKSHYYETCIIY